MGKIAEMSYLFWVISLIFSASKLVDKNFSNPFWKEVSDSKLHEIPFIPSMMISFIPPGHWLLKMGIPKALASNKTLGKPSCLELNMIPSDSFNRDCFETPKAVQNFQDLIV